MELKQQFLKIAGDYTNWNVYRKSLIVCDVNEMFIRRQNQLVTWQRSDSRAIQARRYCRLYDDPSQFVAKCSQRTDETVANIMLTQLHQLDAMLGAVLRKMEEIFINEGGIKEQMSQVRRDWRRRNGQ